MKKGIRVYNLYPKLIGSMYRWISHFDRIHAMHFNWIYVNPIHEPGLSGSDYAVKDYYLYHPLYVTGDYNYKGLNTQKKQGDTLLRKVCREAQRRGMNMMMDIVINHTSIDSPLIERHPEWYVRDEHGNIKHPGAMDGDSWVTWGDLAQINNAHSSDRDNLWKYWLDMVLFYAGLGVRGFRCDAAYHVPSELWRFLIPRVKEKYPDVIFFGETLGCTPHQTIEVAEAGFDYIVNSFKWWNFREDWFLEQYRQSVGRVQSLAFPENHDTVRFAEEYHGNKTLAVMKYAVGAYICSSIAITVGFEYGFRRKIHVVDINPMWWEPVHYDISSEIAAINTIKASYDVLQEDNVFDEYQFHDGALFGFTKQRRDGQEKIMVIVNPDENYWHSAYVDNLHGVLGSNRVQDISHGHKMDQVPNNLEYNLQPGEVKLFYAKR